MSDFMPVLDSTDELQRLLRKEIPDNEAFDVMSNRDFDLLLIAAKESFGTEGTYIVLTYLNNL